MALKGRYYKRIGNSNHLLNSSQISNLHIQSLQMSWDSYPFSNRTYKDLNEHKLHNFINKVNIGGRFELPKNPLEALKLLKLIKDGTVTNAAMILFSKENLYHNVHVGRFRTPSLIIDEKMISGNLFDVVEETLRFIASHIKVAFEITGVTSQRTEIFEYPMAAIREMILNAAVHRDFTSPSDVQIKIFDQQITIYNPGRLYGNIDIDDLRENKYSSELRNKLIAEAFYLTKDIEKYGTGFSRIRDEIKSYPTMRFDFYEQGNGFVTSLSYTKQKISATNSVEPVNDTVNDTVNKLFELIETNPGKRRPFFEKELKVSQRTIHRWLKELQMKDKIEFRGAPKTGGYWVK